MQARIYVLGFIQGVGFRGFVKANARKLGLTGWVQNLTDGRVEALAQGPKEKIETLIKICEKGPIVSGVKSVAVTWEKEDEQFGSFETY
jgi:acylphosphatase